jgi:hypothetical protein
MSDQIVVHHRQGGAVSVEGSEVVVRLGGMAGLFRKKPWAHEYRVPLERATVALEGKFLTVYDGENAVQQVVLPEVGPEVDMLIAAVGQREAAEGAKPMVHVKTYKNVREYEADAHGMIERGWMPVSQSTAQGKVAIGRTAAKAALTGGVGLMIMGRSRTDGQITVTWLLQQ